jgi:hypothetical protein
MSKGLRSEPEATWFTTFADEPDTLPLIAPYRAKVGAAATTGLILGIVALAATLTGLLAPVGVAVGTLGAVISLVGVALPRRRDLAGRPLAAFGLVFALVAVALGVLATSGHLSWLNSRTDEVQRLHAWLVAHLPLMRRWD